VGRQRMLLGRFLQELVVSSSIEHPLWPSHPPCRNGCCRLSATLWCAATAAGRNIATKPTNVFRYDHDLQTDSRPILFLKKNSSDVIFAMSTTIGRIHSASR
jgi:hypothetical protein